MNVSPDLLAFLRGWEGYRLIPYLDSAGKWTVGYGHLLQETDTRSEITAAEAESLLASDVASTSSGLETRLRSKPSQQQWDAVVSLAFNEGVRAIGNSTLMAHLNRSEWDEASYQFSKWVYEHRDGKLVASIGLAKRRKAEQAIFDAGDYSGRP